MNSKTEIIETYGNYRNIQEFKRKVDPSVRRDFESARLSTLIPSSEINLSLIEGLQLHICLTIK